MTDRKLSIVIFARWGMGKSWLAQTAPGPRLVADFEHGALDVVHREDADRGTKVLPWDPAKGGLDVAAIDENTSVVVQIQDYAGVQRLLPMLRSGNHPFESVIVDSLTEVQRQMKMAVANRDTDTDYDPSATFEQQAWGRLKNHGELLVRELRDLTRSGAAKPVNVVIVMGADDERLPIKPLIEGGLRKTLAGFVDIEGYLIRRYDDEGVERGILQIAPTQDVDAKCRPHLVRKAYGPAIVDPRISDIVRVINSEIPEGNNASNTEHEGAMP